MDLQEYDEDLLVVYHINLQHYNQRKFSIDRTAKTAGFKGVLHMWDAETWEVLKKHNPDTKQVIKLVIFAEEEYEL